MALILFLCRASGVYASETAQVPIRADAQVVSTYTVKADPFLELTWNKTAKDYEGTYQVGVRGRIGKGRSIRIVPK